MIIDSLNNLQLYKGIISCIPKIMEILREEDLIKKDTGCYTTSDPNCRYVISEYNTVPKKPFEIHKKEIDLHIVLIGKEKVCLSDRSAGEKAYVYDKENDSSIVFSSNFCKYIADDTNFGIFFPGEPHAPGLMINTQQKIKKVVFKILY